MSLDAELGALLDASLAPLRAEIRRLTVEVEQLRRAIPPMLVPLPVAAARLGVSLSTVRRLMRRGDLPAQRVGRFWMVDLTLLRAPSDDVVSDMASKLMSAAPRER